MKSLSRTISVLLFGLLPAIFAGTPAENLEKKSDDWFASKAGKQAMTCILSWQSPHGDWPKNTDTTTKKYEGDRAKLRGTFDNGATIGELRTLARAFRVTGDERYKAAVLRGFDHILAAQYKNGGWPQYFPLSKSYHRHITFNDGAMIRILEFLDDVAGSKDFAFLDAARQARAKTATERGLDCILKCQIVVEGKPTVWCAQHDAETLAPVKARSYELASLSGGESAGILRYLMSIPDPSPEMIKAVHGGAAWYESAKIEGFRYKKGGDAPNLFADKSAKPIWARFYELKTNRPFFCDRDGIPKYDLNDIGRERRGGYSWYGSWGQGVAEQYATWLRR